MTEPDQPAPVDVDAAHLALDAAVAQLVQPSTERLDRADGQLDDHVAAQRADDRATERELELRHAGYLRAGHAAQARRTLEQLLDHRRRVAARRGSEAVTATAGVVPSLLDQLLASVGGSGGDNGAAGAGAHRAPIALAAAELIGHIQRTIRWGRLASGDKDPHPDVRVQLRRWAARAPLWRDQHPEYLAVAAQHAEGWVASVRALLNPGKRTTITDPCPECRRTVAYVLDDEGQTVRRAALEVDLTHKIGRCHGCHSTWPPEFLARLLQQQRAEDEARDAMGAAR